MSRTILIDIDDTLSATQKSILQFIRQNYGQNYKFHTIAEEFRNGRHKHYQAQVSDFLSQPTLVGDIAPFPNALQALVLIRSAGWDIHIVSSRKQILHDVTRRWLETHGFSPLISDYHARPDKLGGNEFKVLSARKIHADAAIDDTLSVAKALAAANVKTFLIQRPWNKNYPKHPLLSRHRNLVHAANKLVEV